MIFTPYSFAYRKHVFINLDIEITNNGNMCELTKLMTSPNNLIDTERTVGKPGKFLNVPKKHERPHLKLYKNFHIQYTKMPIYKVVPCSPLEPIT